LIEQVNSRNIQLDSRSPQGLLGLGGLLSGLGAGVSGLAGGLGTVVGGVGNGLGSVVNGLGRNLFIVFLEDAC